MNTGIPSSLQSLLETPLAEELYLDWAALLETVLVNYVPPPSHLLLCMTVMIQTSPEFDLTLKQTCHRVLLKTLTRHGTKAFKQVLDFDADNLGRHKRRKVRHPVTDADGVLEVEELADLELTTSNSLCIVFTDLWEVLGCAFSRSGGQAFWWHHLSGFLCKLLEQDWKLSIETKMDLTKTLLVQQMRDKNERRVDSKQIMKCLFADSTLPEYAMADPYERMDTDENTSRPEKLERVNVSEPAAMTMCQRRQILSMLYDVAKVPRLNVLHENEFISTLATIIGPLPLRFITALFDYPSSMTDPFQQLVTPLSNSLLFRLAAYPQKSGKAGERLVDWQKVQGWCASESRSSDELEVVKVQFLKFVLYVDFTTNKENDLPIEQRSEAVKTMKDGVQTAVQSIYQTLDGRRDDWQYNHLATPEELETCLKRINTHLALLLHAYDKV